MAFTVTKESHSFTCTPTRLPVNSMNHAFAFPAKTGPHFTDPWVTESWVDLTGWLVATQPTVAPTRYSQSDACRTWGSALTVAYPCDPIPQRLSQLVLPPSTGSKAYLRDWSINRPSCHRSRNWSRRDLVKAVWHWLIFPVTCWTVSLCLMKWHVLSATLRCTTTSHICYGTSLVGGSGKNTVPTGHTLFLLPWQHGAPIPWSSQDWQGEVTARTTARLSTAPDHT